MYNFINWNFDCSKIINYIAILIVRFRNSIMIITITVSSLPYFVIAVIKVDNYLIIIIIENSVIYLVYLDYYQASLLTNWYYFVISIAKNLFYYLMKD